MEQINKENTKVIAKGIEILSLVRHKQKLGMV